MAGVGKTVALQGLGHDEDILKRFCDGVHYMTFGRGATVQTAIREIAKIMTITGASAQVQNVKSAASLKEAVDYAVPWFQGKICLYLLDDLWPAEHLPAGYLLDLRQLLRGSPDSRMAISTRNFQIASEAGRVVSFEPRDPLGLESSRIFFANALRHPTAQSSSNIIYERSAGVKKILSFCGGLPIALSVTGCAVAKYTRRYGSFERASEEYSKKLEDKRIWLGDERTPEGDSLNAAILLSLEFLQDEFGNRKLHEYSIRDLYTSLCVLENQVWVPVSALKQLWQLDEDESWDIVDLFCAMSLATGQFRISPITSSEELGIVLHDLLLDFCQQRAMETKSFAGWHSRLLAGYLETTTLGTAEIPEVRLSEIPKTQMQQIILNYAPRPWWSTAVADDGYIHGNLCRHLACSGNEIELAALLLDGRWTQMRRNIGGIVALQTDFDLLEKVFERVQHSGDIWRSFELIFKAVRLSWGRMVRGLRVFQFNVCGHLTRMRKTSAVVEEYVKSIEKCTPKPYLLPVSPFFIGVDSSMIMEIPVGGECYGVACTPCGRYIACGAGKDLVVADTSSGYILQRMKGLTSRITCIAFSRGSKKVVSGSEDGTIMLWAWDLCSRFPRAQCVFQGHNDWVSDVDISGDGGHIYSCSSNRILQISDTTAPAQTRKVSQSRPVNCVAVCGAGKMIAFGLDGGALKVVDIITNYPLFEYAEAHKRSVSCVSFSPDSSYIAAGSLDKTISIWNTRTWTREGECLQGHKELVSCVSFSPDGKHIASSSYDRTIRLWDIESGKCFGISPKTSSAMTSVAFTVDGHRIVSGSRDGIVRIWEACLGTEVNENTFRHTDSVVGATISQNGSRVASASRDGTVRLWDTQTGEQVGVPLEGHADTVFCLSFNPNGQQLVSGSRDKTLRLWDTGTHTQIGDPFEGHKDNIRSVSFSSDGLRVLSGYFDSSVCIWNAETHEQIGDLLEGHNLGSSILGLSESSDGCHVASRDRKGDTTIWNCGNRSIVWKSEQFENKITDDEAESIIRSCSQQTPHLWPKSFPVYTAELYCEYDSVYSNFLEGKTLLADSWIQDMSTPFWSYHEGRKVFAAGLKSGAVAICKLIIE